MDEAAGCTSGEPSPFVQPALHSLDKFICGSSGSSAWLQQDSKLAQAATPTAAAMDSDAFDDNWEFKDAFCFGEAAAESRRQFSAQAAAENAAGRRRRTAQRGRSTGRGTAAGRRRAASDPGQPRACRRRTVPSDGPSAASSARGRGAPPAVQQPVQVLASQQKSLMPQLMTSGIFSRKCQLRRPACES